MNRVGYFGGTFDPPHLAHQMCCLWALESGEVDRVLMVPVGRHAFGKKPEACFEHRLEMCRLAARPFREAVEVSPIEGQREETSYTIDSLKALTRENPEWKFRLLIGSDVEEQLDHWRASQEIKDLAPPLVLPRGTKGRPMSDDAPSIPPIASTRLRERLKSGDALPPGLSARVYDYIRKNRLYT